MHAHVRGTHREASDARDSRERARGLARPATKVACNLVKLRMGRKCVKTLRKVVARSLCSTPPERQGSALADPGWRLPFHPHLTATLARAARRRPHMRDDGRSAVCKGCDPCAHEFHVPLGTIQSVVGCRNSARTQRFEPVACSIRHENDSGTLATWLQRQNPNKHASKWRATCNWPQLAGSRRAPRSGIAR